MAQIEANSNLPQPGWFKESTSPVIDPVKGMAMMLRPTAFSAIQYSANAISTPISRRASTAAIA
jgi:hypothetical protein